MKTQIQSKPPTLYLFKGYIDEQTLDDDVQRLTAYYRRLGFFHAEVGREVVFNKGQTWAHVTFVIDEGPQYHIRDLTFEGATIFDDATIRDALRLAPGKPFNQDDLNYDVAQITDLYGGNGYIDAVIQPEPRFLPEPGQIDLVYHITEGDQSRVRNIIVKFQGEGQRTRRNVVLNRMTLYPGDVLDQRKLRDSERRLIRSQLFANDPAQGLRPEVVVSEPILPGTQFADGGDDLIRGQSPDDVELPSPASRFFRLLVARRRTGGAMNNDKFLPCPRRSGTCGGKCTARHSCLRFSFTNRACAKRLHG